MPVPLPDDLVTPTAQGETVLFAGAGMWRPQLPGWRELLQRMLGWSAEQGISLGGTEESIQDLIAGGTFCYQAMRSPSRICR